MPPDAVVDVQRAVTAQSLHLQDNVFLSKLTTMPPVSHPAAQLMLLVPLFQHRTLG
jgi:hypothetical protein